MPKQPTGLESPVVYAQVKALILDGLTDKAIGQRFNVSRQAVGKFRKRHEAELAPIIAAIEKSIEDYAIAHKIKRVAAMNERWERGMALIEARAGDTRYSDEPGYSTGLMVHQVKAVGEDVFDQFAVDSGLLSSMLALENAASDQLGQTPKADQNVNLRAQVLVRQLQGYDPKELG